MYTIRQATPDDLKDLYALARQTYFINLPPDKDIIAHKIEQSTASFRRLATATPASARSASPRSSSSHSASARSGHRATTSLSDLFLFVVERAGPDAPGSGVVGTSQVISAMGGPGHPRVFFQLSKVVRRSESLKRGIEHTVGVIGADESGPSEVGGIIVNQAFRGAGLGKFLSLVRFHLMGLAPSRFAPRVIAEMLGPIDDKGHNPFFEKFTRRFIPHSWEDIYRFSQTSREFVVGLMPPDPIYLTTMEPEVAACAGEVSDATVPARRMLESIGFSYHHRIDPLDGGPHLEAATRDIAPVQATRRVRAIISAPSAKSGRPAKATRTSARPEARPIIVSTLSSTGAFRALNLSAVVEDDRVIVSPEAAAHLHADDAVLLAITDLSQSLAPTHPPAPPRAARSRSSRTR